MEGEPEGELTLRPGIDYRAGIPGSEGLEKLGPLREKYEQLHRNLAVAHRLTMLAQACEARTSQDLRLIEQGIAEYNKGELYDSDSVEASSRGEAVGSTDFETAKLQVLGLLGLTEESIIPSNEQGTLEV